MNMMKPIPAAPKSKTVPVWGDRLQLTVKIAGKGTPLIYLHPAAGLHWDPFLDRLSQTHKVYAPEHPGTTPGASQAIHQVDQYWDLLLAYDDLLRTLGVRKAVLMGQSYGGMIAADLAAHFPDRFSKLVLLAPLGLWREDAPIKLVEFVSDVPQSLGTLFHDPGAPGPQAMLTPPSDPDTAIKMAAAMVWALGCTGKFFWPIADHGLSKRLHRVKTPTLIMWGRQDKLIPPVYAEEFQKRIAGSEVVMLDQCGHLPQLERFEETVEAVSGFLTS